VEIALRGIGVSPGIAIGPALTFGVANPEVPRYQIEDQESEWKRFAKAVEAVRHDLERLHQKASRELGKSQADILAAHLMVLDDPALLDEIQTRLADGRQNVEAVLDDLITQYANTAASVDAQDFRDRIQEVLDIGKRILNKLLNADVESLEHLNRPSIIVAHDLSPSDTAGVDLANTLAIAIDVSGPTSHTAILARAFEIPAVVGLKYVSAHALASDMMIVDGTRGHVFIRPDPSTLEEYEREKKRREEKRLALMHRECESKSSTLDGHKTPTMANIELPVEVTRSLKTGAQGIGLYRTEYLYLNRTTLPTEEEQFRAYSEVAAAMNPRLVILRTLDLGGDKFASHLRVADEINPQLGWRAIRFCLERLDIFKAQLRAMLRATVHGNVSIMFPLISGLDELRRVKQVVQEVCDDLERRVVPFRRDVKLGAMIEVPSAVAIADALARECDFFSIGTNDLVQYALAVDRVNEKIAHMYQPAHPAILRYIRDTVRAARRAHIPCSICGEMAGDPLYTELLVGLGVDSLSMSAVAIPIVRSQIASIRYSSAKRFAKNLLNLSSVEEIKTLLRERLKRSRGIAMIADEITSIEPDGKE